MKQKMTKYIGIITLIAVLMATGCTSLSQYFKGWIITIKPVQTGSDTQSGVSVDTTLSMTSVNTNLVGASTDLVDESTENSLSITPHPQTNSERSADSHTAVNSRRK
jgi:Mg/Co/Ni transporter MgtE